MHKLLLICDAFATEYDIKLLSALLRSTVPLTVQRYFEMVYVCACVCDSVSGCTIAEPTMNSLYRCQNWAGIISDYFSVHGGVRQGVVLSPVLFCVYIDNLRQRLSKSGLRTVVDLCV